MLKVLFLLTISTAYGKMNLPYTIRAVDCPEWVENDLDKNSEILELFLAKKVFLRKKDVGKKVNCLSEKDFRRGNCQKFGDNIIACAAKESFIDINMDLLNLHNAKATIIMHEMLHFLGIMGHSPEKSDVMYKSFDQDESERGLSINDLMRLTILYLEP